MILTRSALNTPKRPPATPFPDIDLHIKSGEIIGIIGRHRFLQNHAWSSLIPRLYDATEGTVKVGGVDVRDYDLETLRNQVAVVLQKNELFSGTIKENLRWGNPNATDEELVEACQPGPGGRVYPAVPRRV